MEVELVIDTDVIYRNSFKEELKKKKKRKSYGLLHEN